MQTKWSMIGAALAVAAVSVQAEAASRNVSVSIAPEKRVLQPNDDVVVRVTFTNTSSTPQYVLKWHTPFDAEIEEHLFEVYRDGVKVPYLGLHAKRQAPKASDYFVIQPGKSHTVKVELSALYDMSVTGNYTLSYHTHSYDLVATGFDANGNPKRDTGSMELSSGQVSMFINGRNATATTAKATDPVPAAAGLTFSKCTSSQAATITEAVSAATSMATDSDAYLGANKTGPRYTTWFGSYDASRYSKVKSNFAAIKDAFLNKPITVDCGCKKTYYAYVYPTQPYTIYVCKAFWSAPMTGTDSKGGTLVHEMSHFNAVAGTDDWVYGQSGAKSLAISDPAKAVDNADSHEYFAENTPAQQ